MNTQTLRGTVTGIKRLANSYNGNPNFQIILTDNNGHESIISTINDYMINYRVSDVMLNQEIEMKVKVNRRTTKLLDAKPTDEQRMAYDLEWYAKQVQSIIKTTEAI
tara:strand:- start:20 stop:340 length:321 start_codon:yes stop_codon:yes gene_type:complete